MGSLKFSQQYGNNKISVNQNQKVVTVPVGVVEPGDKHFIGVVQEITEEKFICSANELSELIECIKGCNAEVGDEVIICLMQDDQYVVVARVGGDLGGVPEYGSTTDYIAGKVFAFAGNVVPAGCLLCDGSEVSRSDYWELFAVIGTLYGAGDGATTFNLPNIESRTIIGESDNYALGTTGGEEKHTLTEAELPHLAGKTWFRNWTWGGGEQGSVFLSPDGILKKETGGTTGYDLLGYGSAQGGSEVLKVEFGGNQPHNNMQPYIVMRYFITTGKADPASGINPADYVVEWGKTGIWHWEKWASGKAECWGSKWIGPIDITQMWDDWYFHKAQAIDNYPFEFTELPNVTAFRGDGVEGLLITSGVGSTTAPAKMYLVRPNSYTDGEYRVHIRAKGFWKTPSASGGTETIAPTIAERFEGIESDILDMRTNKVLWSGAKYMQPEQTNILSEPISAQPNGIVLVWSFYSTDTYDYVNSNFVFTFVPKHFAMNHSSCGINCSGLCPDGHMWKYVYIQDTAIKGYKENDVVNTTGGVTMKSNNYVLRYVLGV